MGNISATPRNQLLGLLADFVGGANKFATHPNGTMPMKVAAGLLGLEPIANTLNEMSYGGSLSTGKGSTWKPKADTIEAAMAVAPFLPKAISATKNLPVGLSINPVEYGLPVNADGTVSLFHGTTKEAAKNILASKRLKSAGEPDVYLTTAKDAGYGDGTVVRVNADPKKLFVDDEFPNGRVDFRMPVRNGEASFSDVGLLKEPFVYPQEQALLTAQRNAALPVEQGGLGLHPNNTPMERAQAMGFDTEAFHGTPDDRLGRSRQFKDSMLGKTTQVEDAKMGHFTVNDGNAASEYIWRDGSTDGGNVLPLRLAGDRAAVSLPGEWMPGRFDNVIQQSKRGGYDGLTIKGTTTLGKPGDYQVTFDPKNIRSRFAAFDPMRRDSPDILAGLLPLSMADEGNRNQLRGLLGY